MLTICPHYYRKATSSGANLKGESEAEADFKQGPESDNAVARTDFLALLHAARMIGNGDFDYPDAPPEDESGDFGTEFKARAAQREGFQQGSPENLVAGGLVGDRGAEKQIGPERE